MHTNTHTHTANMHSTNMQVQMQVNNLSQHWIFVAPNELTLEYSLHESLNEYGGQLWTLEVEGEGGLAGALDQKKALLVILHIKQALDSIRFCTFCLMCQWTESRRHGSDVYLGMPPCSSKWRLLSSVLACVGKTGETVANWNNSRPWIGIFQGAKCDNVPKCNLEFA